jgi:hypothetical protein
MPLQATPLQPMRDSGQIRSLGGASQWPLGAQVSLVVEIPLVGSDQVGSHGVDSLDRAILQPKAKSIQGMLSSINGGFRPVLHAKIFEIGSQQRRKIHNGFP